MQEYGSFLNQDRQAGKDYLSWVDLKAMSHYRGGEVFIPRWLDWRMDMYP